MKIYFRPLKSGKWIVILRRGERTLMAFQTHQRSLHDLADSLLNSIPLDVFARQQNIQSVTQPSATSVLGN